MKNSSDIGNRTRDLPACSTLPQPTVPPRAPLFCTVNTRNLDYPKQTIKTTLRVCVRKLLRLSYARDERLEDKRNYRYRRLTACTALDIISIMKSGV